MHRNLLVCRTDCMIRAVVRRSFSPLLFFQRPRSLEEPVCASAKYRRRALERLCVYMTTQAQAARLGATAHPTMCENSSYNSYEPYEKYQPIGDAPMASLGGASRFSPPRTSWRERPQRSVSPSHGSRTEECARAARIVAASDSTRYKKVCKHSDA